MDRVVIYVAGNPSLYPLEYYDAETETYRGVIPDLLDRFSQNSRYEIRYYQPGSEDRREELAENRQVDLISGCTAGEDFAHTEPEELLVLEATEDGEPLQFRLLFTEQAPEAFRRDLRQFAAGISQEEKTGMLLQVQADAQVLRTTQLRNGLLALGAAVLLLLAALIVVIRKYRKRLQKDAQDRETDPITGIGNRTFLERWYHTQVVDRNRILYRVLCFYTDTVRMDRNCGYEETRQFLRHCAAILNEYVTSSDVLARVQGVGFFLVQLSAGQEAEVAWLPTAIQRIRDFSAMYEKPYSCQVNCSIYALRADDRELDEVLFRALQSAQAAARRGQDFLVCSQDLLDTLERERRLQREIKEAFAQEAFRLHIQFYIQAQTCQVVGGEALARWQHPELGLLLPGSFIPLMERENLIQQMDFYMLEKACAFLDRLWAKGERNFFLSCNFSRKSFSAPDFVERCAQIVGQYTFARELLIFELTESVQATDVRQVQRNVNGVRDLGARVVLDDFGEGFTSFSDLRKFPVDGVKLDKRLVDGMDTPTGKALLGTVIKIGHELGLTTLAEGVESDLQVQALRELHCDVIQGFCFHRPIPEWEAEEALLHTPAAAAREKAAGAK